MNSHIRNIQFTNKIFIICKPWSKRRRLCASTNLCIFSSGKKKYPGVLEIKFITFRLCWNTNHSEERVNKLKTKLAGDIRFPTSHAEGLNGNK